MTMGRAVQVALLLLLLAFFSVGESVAKNGNIVLVKVKGRPIHVMVLRKNKPPVLIMVTPKKKFSLPMNKTANETVKPATNGSGQIESKPLQPQASGMDGFFRRVTGWSGEQSSRTINEEAIIKPMLVIEKLASVINTGMMDEEVQDLDIFPSFSVPAKQFTDELLVKNIELGASTKSPANVVQRPENVTKEGPKTPQAVLDLSEPTLLVVKPRLPDVGVRKKKQQIVRLLRA